MAWGAELMLRCEELGWSVGDVPILRDVTLAFRPNCFTGVIGPNGSGKTSLLRLLTGVTKPTTGTVWLGETDLHRLSSRQRARRVALLEQHAVTGLGLTVREVVELGRIPHRGRWPGAVHRDADVIDAALRRGHVHDLAERQWTTLSGGEQQRVQLARSLAQEPEFLFLDEPTNHLDLGHQIDFVSTVRDAAPTVIAALHDLDLAAAFCDDLVVLQHGRVLVHGPTHEVLDGPLIAKLYGIGAVVEEHPVAQRRTVTWISRKEM